MHNNTMHSDNLCEILWAEKDFYAKQKIIEGLIYKMELSFVMKNNIYCMATELIESQRGQLKVCEVARILYVSTRTLERQFLRILGITPKQFIRAIPTFHKSMKCLSHFYNTFLRNLNTLPSEICTQEKTL